MKEILITFQVAKLAKEKGFYQGEYRGEYPSYSDDGNIHSVAYFDSDRIPYYGATQSLLQKWLREEHNIHIEPNLNFVPDTEEDYGYMVNIMTYIDSLKDLKWLANDITGNIYSSYEEALEAGLKEGLKII